MDTASVKKPELGRTRPRIVGLGLRRGAVKIVRSSGSLLVLTYLIYFLLHRRGSEAALGPHARRVNGRPRQTDGGDLAGQQ